MPENKFPFSSNPLWMNDPVVYLNQIEDDFRRDFMAKLGSVAGGVLFLAAGVRHLITPLNLLSCIAFVMASVLLGLPYLIKRKVSTSICGLILIFSLDVVAIIAGLTNGGVRAPASILYVMIPLIGYFCLGRYGAGIALVSSFCSAIGVLIADRYGLTLPLQGGERYPIYMTTSYLFAAVLMHRIGAAYERVRMNSQELIKQYSFSVSHQAKLISLSEVAVGIAHEINNPLAIIMGSLPLLQGSASHPENFKNRMETIQKATLRIERIVKGLQKYNRNAQSHPFRLEMVSEIVQGAVKSLEFKSKRYSTPIYFEVDPNLKIYCDQVEIEQVLVNLIQNGIDANQANPIKWVQVKGYQDQEHGQIVIQVIDSGSGVPPEIEEKLFQPFFSTKAIGEGTGLGLCVSKGILDQHKATLSLNHKLQNTCFEIRFSRSAATEGTELKKAV